MDTEPSLPMLIPNAENRLVSGEYVERVALARQSILMIAAIFQDSGLAPVQVAFLLERLQQLAPNLIEQFAQSDMSLPLDRDAARVLVARVIAEMRQINFFQLALEATSDEA